MRRARMPAITLILIVTDWKSEFMLKIHYETDIWNDPNHVSFDHYIFLFLYVSRRVTRFKRASITARSYG